MNIRYHFILLSSLCILLHSKNLLSMKTQAPIETVILPCTHFFTVSKQDILNKEFKFKEDANTPWYQKFYNKAVDTGASLFKYKEQEVLEALFAVLSQATKKRELSPIYYQGLRFPDIYNDFFTTSDKKTAEKLYARILNKIENASTPVSKLALTITAKYTLDEIALASVMKINKNMINFVEKIKKTNQKLRVIFVCNYPLYMWDTSPLRKPISQLFEKENIFLSGAKDGAVYPSQKLWKKLNINPVTAAVFDTEKEHLSLCTYKNQLMRTASTQQELLQLLGMQKIKL